jgi:hypothetical protein
MDKDEALRLAWGALEDIGDEWGFTSQRTVPKRKEAITAIKEALAQREQDGECKHCTDGCPACDARKLPEQERFALKHRIAELEGAVIGLQAQRTWVGLMDNEAIELAMKVIARLDLPSATKMQLEQQFIRALNDPNSLWMLFAAEIEAKLKEKNHG